MNNYTIYHCHTDISNVSGAGMDSVTKFQDYVSRAKECGMNALGFSEHGNIFLWKKKKDAIEAAGMKYLHGIEIYVTEKLLWETEDNPKPHKIRDNYHCVLIAKNLAGLKEINKLSSIAFRSEQRYYTPRITFEQLINTSENVIITSACFVKGTKVLTKQGEKNIEDIKSGDLIKNINGEWEQVNYPTQIGYCGTGCEIKVTGDYSPIRCTEDHKFLAISYNDYEKKWIEAKNLCVKNTNSKNVLLFPLTQTYTDEYFIYRSQWNNFAVTPKRQMRNKIPDTIHITNELMRFFGLYLGDGYTSLGKVKRIGITFRDSEFDLYYRTVVLPVEKQLGIKFSVCKRPELHRVDIVSYNPDVINLFCYLFQNKKADEKFIPECLINISKELDEELLFGYILSDGCIRETSSKFINQKTNRDVASHRLTISSVSEKMIRQTFNIFRGLGVPATLRKVNGWVGKDGTNHKESYYLESNNAMLNTDVKLREYSHEEVCGMFSNVSSKNKHIIELDGNLYYRVGIKDITNFDINETVYCMNTPSHSFVCNDVIVHNCVGGIICKGNESIRERFVEFLSQNKDRCFLEIQHHNTEKQKVYNQYLYELNQKYGIPLIAGTDTHSLNEDHAKARVVLQEAKDEKFNDDETGWDMTFKTYDELVKAYREQDCLPESVYLEAIQNTNAMADMAENITLDTSFKYPKVFQNSIELLRSKLFSDDAIKYAMEDGFTREQVIDRLNEEMETFIAVDAVDYILLQAHIATWCHNHDIWCGPARGSAASSLSLYVLHVTEVNPMKHNFAFWRFMHKDKYSLAD